MARLIIVGIDGSETSMTAGRRAAALARAEGAVLHVVTAYHSSSVTSYSGGRLTAKSVAADEAEKVLQQAIEELQRITPEVDGTVVFDSPANALLDEATRLEAQMIVVGNRDMRGIGRVLGSITNTVSHNAPCDVYIVKTV